MITTEIQLPEPIFRLIQTTLDDRPLLSFDDVITEALCLYLSRSNAQNP